MLLSATSTQLFKEAWQDLQIRAENLAQELGNIAGNISFIAKPNSEVTEADERDAKFIENLNSGYRLYYDVWKAHFFIYTGDKNPLEEETEDEDWANIDQERLQEILGYIASIGYTEHITILMGIGNDVTVIPTENGRGPSEGTIEELFKILKELNKHFFPMNELTGKLEIHVKSEKKEEQE
jgi:hypothetical protein